MNKMDETKQEMNRFLQAKTFGACRPSHSTHERLFTKHEKPRKDVREQFIRDRELEGHAVSAVPDPEAVAPDDLRARRARP